MDLEQSRWTAVGGWEPRLPGSLRDAQLVMIFGCPEVLKDPSLRETLAAAYPHAFLFGCSTAGDIYGTHVSDDSLVVTAIRFQSIRVVGRTTRIQGPEDSLAAGERLALSLAGEGLVHIFVLSDGLHVNGSKLVEGLARGLPPDVTVTGGLSGDGPRFKETLVLGGTGNSVPEPCTIAAVGFYGRSLRVGYASLGGWDPFGPERLITRSDGNVLYELDGRSALELYKTYLGPHARELPASGLLFPLSLRTGEGCTPVVRTILSVDEEHSSMTFAGDVPEGSYARFMKANFDRLIDGAVGAARTSYEAVGSTSPDLALLVSCVGRKLVLKQRVEEEVEGVREVLGDRTVLAGFYSYGEISPFTPDARCELHNQTMTITTLTER
ncbi:MAG TPA: FIST N-terminal domain-containing protein [Thermoanaerobaculia bacterium]|nr:FIST N-terminal domain-containing protein [Thermoanaerobaculia bacterium]